MYPIPFLNRGNFFRNSNPSKNPVVTNKTLNSMMNKYINRQIVPSIINESEISFSCIYVLKYHRVIC